VGTQYIQPADLLGTGINPIALDDVDTPTQTTACQQASELADSYMRGRYALPLSSWGQDIKFRVAQIAVWMLLKARGVNPDAGADSYWQTEYQDAIRWFEGVQRQSVHPDVTPAVAQPGDPTYDLPQVRTSPQRGWLTSNANGKPTVGW